MTLHGFRSRDNNGDHVIVITSAPTKEEFVIAKTFLEESGINFGEPSDVEFFSSPFLSGLADAYVSDSITDSDVERIGLTLVSRARALELHRHMLDSDKADLFKDPRSIREIFNIPMPEQPEGKKDEARLKDTAGGSFASPEEKKDRDPDLVRVTDVTAKVSRDGKVVDVDVIAVKPQNDKEDSIATPAGIMVVSNKPVLGEIIALLNIETIKHGAEWALVGDRQAAAQLIVSGRLRDAEVAVYAAADGLVIEDAEALGCGRGPFSMFYRIDVRGITIERLIELAKGCKTSYANVIAAGETSEFVWLGITIERLAKQFEEAIRDGEPTAEIDLYAVNPLGERIAPEGVQVIDINDMANYGPRPWDADTAAWEALSDVEKKAERKKITGAEFFFTGSWDPKIGTRVFFTPRAHFERTDEQWEGDAQTYVDHLLPQAAALVHSEGNLYKSRSLSYDSVVFTLARSKFVESTFYRLWMNNNV